MSFPLTKMLTLLLSAALGSGCRSDSKDRELGEKAKAFRADLLAAVSAASRIEVVEHSWRYDFLDDRGEPVEDPPHLEYKRVALTPEQQAELHQRFEAMSEDPKTAFAACIFEPHHSIELTAADGGKSVISVCFTCDDTKWDGSVGPPPREFQEVLLRFIEPLGFQAHREWHELAINQAQQGVAPQSATRFESNSEGGDKPQPESDPRPR